MARRRPLLLPALTTLAVLTAGCASSGGGGVTTDAPAAESAVAEVAGAEVADAAARADSTDLDVADDRGADDRTSTATADAEAASAEALWWTADTVDGETFVAADLAGESVVLWMWAPWCSVCNREAPEVAEALADLPDDVTIIGVAGRDDVEPMRAFIAEHGLQDITHVVDEDGSVWASYGISYQPAWVFIDDAGEAAVAAGAIGYDGIFAGIDQVFRG